MNEAERELLDLQHEIVDTLRALSEQNAAMQALIASALQELAQHKPEVLPSLQAGLLAQADLIERTREPAHRPAFRRQVLALDGLISVAIRNPAPSA